MNYKIEPIFLLLPIICLFFHASRVRKNNWFHLLLIFIFIILYSFSLNGSDIVGYKKHYIMVERGASVFQNEQEIGYYYIMKLAITLGLDYIHFRIILLSFVSLILFYSLKKFTDAFPLTLFFISTLFVIYTISAYRQYIVIAFSILFLYKYSCGKKIFAIFCTSILLLIHITAILPLGCMVYELYRTNKRVKKTTEVFKKYFIFLIILAIIVRGILTYLLKTSFVHTVFSNILGQHASPEPSFFTFGLVSRMSFLLLITYMYRKSKSDNQQVRLLFWYYFLSISFYIAIPLEFVMGRLMNNAHVLCSVLIPMLRNEIYYGNNLRNKKIKSNCVFIIGILIFLSLIILYNQLLKQNGYTPYLNVLRGDRITVFPIAK